MERQKPEQQVGSGTYFYQIQAGDYTDARKMVILKYAQTNIVTTISPIVSKQRAFCWLKTGLGLMSLGGICSAYSAHRYRFPCLVSRYTNAGEAWTFTIGRGMAELVGLLVWPSAWHLRAAQGIEIWR